MIKKPFVTDVPCVTSDYLPTMMDILKISKSNTPNPLDGISLLPLLEGRMKERPKPIGSCYPGQASYSDNQYKLNSRNGAFELYDIVKDPYEKKDIQNEDQQLLKKNEKRSFEVYSLLLLKFRRKRIWQSII
jgi:arylsulfatase A-like enzyme